MLFAGFKRFASKCHLMLYTPEMLRDAYEQQARANYAVSKEIQERDGVDRKGKKRKKHK